MNSNITNVIINIEKGKICFTVGERKTPEISLDTEGESGANNIRVELGIAKVFHKALNLLKAEKDLFQKEDFEFLGEMLSKILFGKKEEWRQVLMSFTEQSIEINNENSNRVCRIFLEFDQQSGVAMLPWEYTLYKTSTSKVPESFYISANKKSRFHLMRRVSSQDYSIEENSKLFLIVLANVEGNPDAKIANSEAKIDRRKEDFKEVKERFEKLVEKYPDRLFVEYRESVARNEVKQVVEEIYTKWQQEHKIRPYYAVHYYGHATMRDQVGWLVVKDPETKRSDWVEDKKFSSNFSEILLDVKQPSMVCFQACDSAKIGTVNNQLRGVAYEFTRLNIPAVIGMQNEVDTASSTAFFENFYEQVLKGKDVAEAVTFGRDYLGRIFKLDGEPYKNNSFGSPVLFITTAEPITLITNQTISQSPDTATQQSAESAPGAVSSAARVKETETLQPEAAETKVEGDRPHKPIESSKSQLPV